MKKLVLIPALFFGAFAVKTANAQIGLHVNLHLGGLHASAVIPVVPAAQVVEEPAYADDYYYYPEVEAYYSVPEHCYYYQDNYGSWVSAAYLPGRYHDFDWRTARRVEIRSQRPYAHHDVYRSRYGGWSNRDDYYARAFPGRDRDMPSPGFNRNDRRDWNGSRDNGYSRDYNRGDRDKNGYNSNPGRNQGGYSQPDQNRGQQGSFGQGGNGRQHQNQGGYSQPDQNRGQGGFGQGQNRSQYGQGQQDGGQNHGGQSQDQNQGHSRGGFGGGQYTQHGMGVINGNRSANMALNNRPTAGF